MTSYVLTLIGNVQSAPLEQVHIDLVSQGLEPATDGEIRQDWLAEGEACDLFIETEHSSADITSHAEVALSGTAAGGFIDVVCIPAEGRRKKIFISDMDSTVINQECIDELGDAFGVGVQIRQITQAVIRGDITFPDALRQRMALMKGMDHELLASIYEDRITLMSGACTLVKTMRNSGAYCVLVSGGFSYFTSRIAERIGFHEHHGNELVFKDGKLTGEVCDPILGRTAKQQTLNALCEKLGLDPADVLAVGDGANDIKMVQSAGLGIAFHGSGSVKKIADASIDHGDLTALLYIQGFRKSEFEVC